MMDDYGSTRMDGRQIGALGEQRSGSSSSLMLPCFRWLTSAARTNDGLSWLCYRRDDKEYYDAEEGVGLVQGERAAARSGESVFPVGYAQKDTSSSAPFGSSTILVLPPSKPYYSLDSPHVRELNVQRQSDDGDVSSSSLPVHENDAQLSPVLSAYMSNSGSEGFLTPIEESVSSRMFRLQEARLAYNLTLAMRLGYALRDGSSAAESSTALLTRNMVAGPPKMTAADDTHPDSVCKEDLRSLADELYEAAFANCSENPYDNCLLAYSESMTQPVILMGGTRPLCLRIWRRDSPQTCLIRGEFYVEATPRAFCEFSSSNLSCRPEWDGSLTTARVIEEVDEGVDIAYLEFKQLSDDIPSRNAVVLRVMRPGPADSGAYITAACSIDHSHYVMNPREEMVRGDIRISYYIAHPLHHGNAEDIIGSRVEFLVEGDTEGLLPSVALVCSAVPLLLAMGASRERSRDGSPEGDSPRDSRSRSDGRRGEDRSRERSKRRLDEEDKDDSSKRKDESVGRKRSSRDDQANDRKRDEQQQSRDDDLDDDRRRRHHSKREGEGDRDDDDGHRRGSRRDDRTARRSSRDDRSSRRSRSRGSINNSRVDSRKGIMIRTFDSPPKELAAQAAVGASLLPQTVVSSSSTIKEAFNATLAAERQKIARELYVGQIPPGISAAQLIDVLNDGLMNMGANAMPGRPIVHGWLGGDGLFAFVEFRTAEEASIALERLNGHQLKSYGVTIKVGRPKGYMGPAPEDSVNAFTAGTAAAAAATIPGGVSAAEVSSDTSRLCLTGFPVKASEHSIKRALRSASKGEIRHLELLKHTWNDEQIVLAVFECGDIESEHRLKKKGEVEIQGMKAKIINPKDAIVKGQYTQILAHDDLCDGDRYMNLDGDVMKKAMGLEIVPSRILVMTNFAGSVEELLDDINYSDLLDDIKVECKSITGGVDVRSIIIPRPESHSATGGGGADGDDEVNTPDAQANGQHHDSATMDDGDNTAAAQKDTAVPAVDMQVPGLGCCFIEFRNVEEAGQVKRILDGRFFGGHEVFVTYFSETRFQRGDFANPMPNTDEPELGLKDIGENAPLLDDGMEASDDEDMMEVADGDADDDQDMNILDKEDTKARKKSKQPSPALAAEDLEIID
ncbi:hypothetical protein FOZ61_010033 [Perkinsus olseni]|uniref:Uncharacterized protein n=1 Tax=Perkinsus olseni TaxID=32597 RepID=A0A7J6M475_PEROL|nr:hypothetical protein FOZ61_010033 [Perkinsus olseni]KAF4672491.1 hypothetical protein FOL46_008884 [Perkinsus olseni]